MTTPEPGHPDDASKEDVIALDPAESVVIARRFRTFKSKYVCHCHNLAHEDHAMMFGWDIVSMNFQSASRHVQRSFTSKPPGHSRARGFCV